GCLAGQVDHFHSKKVSRFDAIGQCKQICANVLLVDGCINGCIEKSDLYHQSSRFLGDSWSLSIVGNRKSTPTPSPNSAASFVCASSLILLSVAPTTSRSISKPFSIEYSSPTCIVGCSRARETKCPITSGGKAYTSIPMARNAQNKLA